MSPSIDGPGSGASGRPPGSSSSIGKLITSVGPGRSIQRMCRSAIAAVSSSTIESSAAGLTFILRMTNRATLTSSSSETSMPDSLDTSMLTRLTFAVGRRDARRCARFISAGSSDLAYASTISDTSRCRTTSALVSSAKWMSSMPSRMSHRRTQPGRRATGQVHLRDVAGDNDLRPEAQPGQEHLHLLAGGVLRLVENDERVVEGVVREQEILGDVERVRSRHLDAYRFLGARGSIGR